ESESDNGCGGRAETAPRLGAVSARRGSGYLQIDAGVERRQRFSENELPVPLPSQITSLGRFRSAMFRSTWLPFSTLPPGVDEITRIPPAICASLDGRFRATTFASSTTSSAPAITMPTPEMAGESSLAGHNLLFRTEALCSAVHFPATPLPVSRKMKPTQLPV